MRKKRTQLLPSPFDFSNWLGQQAMLALDCHFYGVHDDALGDVHDDVHGGALGDVRDDVHGGAHDDVRDDARGGVHDDARDDSVLRGLFACFAARSQTPHTA